MDVEAATYWLGWVRLAQFVAVFLVALGVAAEFAGEWISRPLENIIDRARELRMAQLTNEAARLSAEIETARASIAEANARAVQAQLALAQFRAPRTLSSEQQARLVEKLKPFAGTKFDVAIVAGEIETVLFCNAIEDVLKAAGWNELDWNQTEFGMVLNRESTGRTMAGSIPSATGLGIVLRSSDGPEITGIASALETALKQEGVNAGVLVDIPVKSTNAPAIHLIVGTKPR